MNSSAMLEPEEEFLNKDIEIEEEERGNEEITKPFDPSKIDVNIEVVNLGSLLDQLRYGEIELSPEFQRESDLWTSEQKSRLIESILLGLPLPSFYFSEDKQTKKLAVIDGLQRICALKDFILNEEKPLVLNGMQFLLQFNGKTYADLGRSEIKRINSLKITMNTLRKDTPIDVKYVIFQRVNTSGIPLTPQEMRHALNQGKAAIFIQQLAKSESFRRATDYRVPAKRMEDRDFVNRFIAFYLLDYKTNYEGELDSFMNKGMSMLNHMPKGDLDSLENAFYNSMNTAWEIWGNDTFRKRYDKEDTRKRISKAIYDALSVNLAVLSKDQQNILIRNKEVVKDKFIELCHNDRFITSISVGTAQKAAIEYRFTEINKFIRSILL